MANIKSDKPIEKVLSWREKGLAMPKGLEDLISKGVQAEKIRNIEKAQETVINEINQAENMPSATIGPVLSVAVPGSIEQKKIENVLATGLEDIYMSLAPEKKKEFKRLGEETANKINQLLAKARINLGDIIRLIKKWLSLIPGINKYFLEQEAKIKADEIIKMKQVNK
jgi:hypothetical protein